MKHKLFLIRSFLVLILLLGLAVVPVGPAGAQEPPPCSTSDCAPELAEEPEVSSMPCTGDETVLLIQDNAPWDYDANVNELTAQGKNFCIANSWDVGTTNLAQFAEIMISAAQNQTFYNNLFPDGMVHPSITAYVQGGGILSANLTDWASGPGAGGNWAGDEFVGGLGHVTFEGNDDLNITAPAHDIIADALLCPSANCGQIVDAGYRNDLDGWNYSTHGYFTNLPDGTGTILVDGADRPVMVEYPFGAGTVIATLTTTEWMSKYGNPKLLANEIAYQDSLVHQPVAEAGGPYSGDEGWPINLDGTGSSDPDSDPLTYSWTVESALCSFDDASSATPDLTCTDNGEFIVTLEVDDGQGGTDSDTANVTVHNVAPTVGPIAAPSDPVMVGTSFDTSADFTDPGTADTHTAVWDWGDSTSDTVDPATSPTSASHTYGAAGVYQITLTVTDDDGGSGQSVFQYVVVYDPDAGFVTGGGWIDSPPGAYYPAPLPLFDGSYYQLVPAPGIPWTDADAAASAMTLEGCVDGHLVTITSQEEQDALYSFFDGELQGKWYGGFQEPGVQIPDEAWHWITGEPWDYTNWAPGEPNDAYGPGSEPHLIGWLDGWAWNDEGNLGNVTGYVVEYDNCLTGKANFGFVSKYKKGADTPTGNTEFHFLAAGLNFHSSSYDWLVVTGSNYAKFKGVSTINGELAPNGEAYKFILWAGDGEPDTFRIKIWWEEGETEHVVYDNGMDQAIGGGSIVVHTKK